MEIEGMEEEFKYGLMEVDMKVIGLKIKQINKNQDLQLKRRGAPKVQFYF